MTTNQPRTAEPIDLDAIRERRERARRWYGGPHHHAHLYARSSDDVLPLVAEVEALRAQVAIAEALYEPPGIAVTRAYGRAIDAARAQELLAAEAERDKLRRGDCVCTWAPEGEHGESGHIPEPRPFCPQHGDSAKVRERFAWWERMYDQLARAVGVDPSEPFPPLDVATEVLARLSQLEAAQHEADRMRDVVAKAEALVDGWRMGRAMDGNPLSAAVDAYRSATQLVGAFAAKRQELIAAGFDLETYLARSATWVPAKPGDTPGAIEPGEDIQIQPIDARSAPPLAHLVGALPTATLAEWDADPEVRAVVDDTVRQWEQQRDEMRGGALTADEWNAKHPIGTRVRAYPGARDGRFVDGPTRSAAWNLGDGQPVVAVEGLSGGIALTHVDLLPAEPTVDGDR